MAVVWNFVVEDGTGLADANSYVSVEDYILYCQSRDHIVHTATPEDLEAIKHTLVKSTDLIDMSWDYHGEPVHIGQALEFPRMVDGVSTGVPRGVKKAVYTAAMSMPENGNFHTITTGNVTSKSEKVGPIEVTTKYSSSKTEASGTFYPAVYAHIKPYTKLPITTGAYTLGQIRTSSG